MQATIEQIKQYKKYKFIFARKFGANETTVQKCVDELLIVAYANNNILDPLTIVNYIDTNDCQLKKIFLFYNPKTQEEKIAIINEVLSLIPILIGTNNTIYLIKQEV